MKILLVEDNVLKVNEVVKVLKRAGVPSEGDIVHETSVSNALNRLKENKFDLLLLDLSLPIGKYAEPDVDGGKELLRRMMASDIYLRPSHIVGITEYDEAYKNALADFDLNLWTIVKFDRADGDWIEQIEHKINHLLATDRAAQFGESHQYDLAIICALRNPELDAVLKINAEWTELDTPQDPTTYLTGSFDSCDGVKRSIVACSAATMGLSAAAALTAKVCVKFKPKVVLMTGICAGRVNDVNLGDVIVANPSWDYGSGKFSTEGEETTFAPNPVQIALDPMLRSAAEKVSVDAARLDELKRSFDGNKPQTTLSVHIAPLASGAAVRADDNFFHELATANRKVLGVDMEAYGVFAAASEMPAPRSKIMVVKGVSDFANSDKDDSVREYAAKMSAEVSFDILKKFNWNSI